MLVAAGGARDLRIGDVTDECVREGVLRLAVDRTAPLATDELLANERMQVVL